MSGVWGKAESLTGPLKAETALQHSGLGFTGEALTALVRAASSAPDERVRSLALHFGQIETRLGEFFSIVLLDDQLACQTGLTLDLRLVRRTCRLNPGCSRRTCRILCHRQALKLRRGRPTQRPRSHTCSSCYAIPACGNGSVTEGIRSFRRQARQTFLRRMLKSLQRAAAATRFEYVNSYTNIQEDLQAFEEGPAVP